jgi:undecaprenyl-diphosphatase
MDLNNLIFKEIFSLSSNIYLREFSLFLSYPFTYIVIISLFLWALFISKKKMFNFSFLFLSVISSWLISNIIKYFIAIERPFRVFDITPLYNEMGFSFPSQHSAVFATIATCIFFLNKKWGIFFIIVAILVGLSRIVIGVHYPMDILGGFLVGLLVGLFFIKIFKRI